jgi:nucleoside-diphosphate-sugar epimerase
MNITVIRPPMLFGPYDHEVSIWINAIRKSGIFFIPFIRTYRFSMAHSEDVCQILYLATEKGERLPGPENTESQSVGTGIYYVSQTEHPTYMEMGRLFGKALGRKFTLILPVTSVLVLFVCLFMNLRRKITGKHYAMSLDKFLEIMAGSWSCSADKARVQLGFQNAHTLLEQCKSTAEWLKRPKS